MYGDDINGDEILNEPTKLHKCLFQMWKFTTFLMSHIGLLSLVITYCVLGAFTFEGLERHHELNIKNNVSQVRAEVSKFLWDMTQKKKVIKPNDWKKSAASRLEDFESELILLMKKRGWDGSENNATQQWTFSGALFYSIVVITTIGYGNLAPKTDWGKIVTILYAVVGIPLMLLCLSHIGDFMASAFRILYWKVCCYLCNRQVARFSSPPPLSRGRRLQHLGSSRFSSRGPIRRSIRTRSARTSQRSADSAFSEQYPMTTPVAAASSSFRRVHSTEEVGRHNRRRRGISRLGATTGSFRQRRSPTPGSDIKSFSRPGSQRRTYRSTTSAEPSSVVPIMSNNLPVLCNKYAEDVTQVTEQQPPVASRNYRHPVLLEQFELDEYFPEEEEYLWEDAEEVGKRPVPIWLCVLLVFSYILAGAVIFSQWEGWSLLNSVYFCFVTLTTIGFGDYVPLSGHKREQVNVEASVALCSLYLLFGISLLAMSFNLVQEQVISSIKRVASRLGIIKDEDGS